MKFIIRKKPDKKLKERNVPNSKHPFNLKYKRK